MHSSDPNLRARARINTTPNQFSRAKTYTYIETQRITVVIEMLNNGSSLAPVFLVVQHGKGGWRIILLLGRLLSRANVREFSTVYIAHKGEQRFREHMELAGRDGRIERATAAATLHATIIASSTYTNSR